MFIELQFTSHFYLSVCLSVTERRSTSSTSCTCSNKCAFHYIHNKQMIEKEKTYYTSENFIWNLKCYLLFKMKQGILTTSVNKLYSIRINQVRLSVNQWSIRLFDRWQMYPVSSWCCSSSCWAQFLEQDWTFNLHLQTSKRASAPRSPLAKCACFTVGSSWDPPQHVPIYRHRLSGCLPTRSSQRSWLSQTPGPMERMRGPRQMSRLNLLRCLKAITAPVPSRGRVLVSWLKDQHYSFVLHLFKSADFSRPGSATTAKADSRPFPPRQCLQRGVPEPFPALAGPPTVPTAAGIDWWSGSLNWRRQHGSGRGYQACGNCCGPCYWWGSRGLG